MGIMIDSATTIVYKGRVIDFSEVREREAGPKTVCAVGLIGELADGTVPEDYLVGLDILDAPMEIFRAPDSEELVLEAVITERVGGRKKYQRPYTRIEFVPRSGAVHAVLKRPTTTSFNERENIDGQVTIFDRYKNRDLEVIVYHHPV